MDGALAVTTFYLYDRWDNQIGTVMGTIEARRSWTLNGEHLLTIRTPMPLSKGQRVVYSDTMGKYREFIVSETTESDESGVTVTVATCEDSIAELLGDFLVEKEPNGSALTCLNSALSSSRWVAGTVDVAGTNRLSFYHCSARQAVNDVAEAFGAELSTTIEVSGSRITARKVNLTTRVGADNGARFTCRKGLQHVERAVLSDDVCTRLYGYGKSLECTDAQGNATGGFSRKLDFASVNGGKEYVESASALQTWGRPNGSGGKAHVDGIVEFPDCEDKAELKALTIEELERRSVPKVSYSATLTTLQAAGLGARGVGDGDTVAIVDENFDPPLRLSGRCLAIDENLLDRTDTVVTLGNIVGTVADSMLVQQQGLASLSSHAASWDGAAQVSSSYINAIVNRLNEEFDAGGSYKYESFEAGTIYSSVPLDDNLKPVRTPATAIQLSGLGLRIASGVKSNGEFDWRTFGTGAGFTADVINAGTIRGGSSHWNLETGDLLFKQGSIADSKGRSVWNLTTGELVTNYMKATNIDASGKFQCGSSAELMVIQNGQIIGSESGTMFGYIDFSAHSYNIYNTSERYKGIQMQANGIIRISSPRIAVAATSDTGVAANIGYSGEISQPLVREIVDSGNGKITWYYGTLKMSFINGLLVGLTTVGDAS